MDNQREADEVLFDSVFWGELVDGFTMLGDLAIDVGLETTGAALNRVGIAMDAVRVGLEWDKAILRAL